MYNHLVVRYEMGVRSSSGGPGHRHTDVSSIFVTCDDQAEVHRYWDALAAEGKPVMCGWLVEKFGASRKIAPRRLMELQADPDPAKVARVVQAMMGMVKLDVARLEKAAAGEWAARVRSGRIFACDF